MGGGVKLKRRAGFAPPGPGRGGPPDGVAPCAIAGMEPAGGVVVGAADAPFGTPFGAAEPGVMAGATGAAAAPGTAAAGPAAGAVPGKRNWRGAFDCSKGAAAHVPTQ